jgi:Phosphotransferase system cellobiose-specific component IIB
MKTYKIALVCVHGASTSIIVKKMTDAALDKGVEAEIKAFSDKLLANIIDEYDIIMIGPQLAFRAEEFKALYKDMAYKFTVIDTIDFGMMNGGKILDFAIKCIEENDH